MADKSDQDSKTEEPTENKIRDELDRGNVPYSREASVFASLAGILIIAAFLVRDSAHAIVELLKKLLADADVWPLRNGYDALALFDLTAWETFEQLIPLFAILLVAGVLASIMQNPPKITPERIQPDVQRISLVNGWRRIFGARGQVEFIKSLLKLISAGVVIWMFLPWEQGNLVNAMAL